MNEIIPNLWLGDMTEVGAAQQRGMEVLSVMWGEEDGSPVGVHNIQTTNFTEGISIMANCEKMNEAADWIHRQIDPVFVHCAFGMERSPLTVMWYLMRHHDYALDEAYRLVKTKHPFTADRRYWLSMNWQTMVKDGLQKEAA